MTHPDINSSEQHTDTHYLPSKRKAECDDASSKHEKTNIDESPKITAMSDGDPAHDPACPSEGKQSTTISNTHMAMKSTHYQPSNALESPLPPLPQVIRRITRPCLLQGRTLQRPPTHHVTPDVPEPEQTAPRWHKQSYMLFLALRQHPDHAMPRTNLIKTALDLDRTISQKLNFPLVFGGRTPQNSASALLTNNRGRHFQSYRPSGSRTMHFRLAFEPADFDKAVATYRQWMKTLINRDWPLCFGKSTATDPPYVNGSALATPNSSSLPSSPLSPYTAVPDPGTISPSTMPPDDSGDLESSPSLPLLTEFDEFIAIRQKERRQLKKLNREKEMGNVSDGSNGNRDQYHLMPLTPTNTCFVTGTIDSGDHSNSALESICDSIPWKIQGDDDYQASSKIPTCWQDIVYVRQGNRNNYGGGVYAQRRLPINTPIGFYFGTPTVEDEFQLVKEEKGKSTDFCLLYGRTVLDATDDQGQPFADPLKELDKMYCPFHFIRQADSSDKANVLFLKGKIYNQVICWTKRVIQQNEELLVWLKCE